MTDYETYDLGDVVLQSGATLRDATLADKTFGAIKAKAILMPASTDLYVPPEDNAIEAKQMPNAELRIVDTFWGHFAGGPGTSPDDIAVLDAALTELLAS